jgi:hypothetical protein
MRTLNDYFLTGKITTISTAGSSFVTAPDSGKIIKIYTSIKNAISSANAGLSFEIGGTAVGDGGITIAYSGSAAGDVDSATPSSANYITEGQPIEMITDGASSTACECEVTFVIRRIG